MAFQVSPGIQVSEVDLTNVVPAVSSTVGAFAGSFQWGPVDEVVTVSDSQGLVDNFYHPANTDAGAEDFYTAEGFLRYGSALRIVRINATGLYSANYSGHATSLIKNLEEYRSTYKDLSQHATVGKFTAKYAGLLGNSLRTSVCASSDAYYNDAVSSSSASAGAAAIGATAITLVADGGVKFTVGDIITFANHTTHYQVTAINTDVLTIKALNQPAGTGLTSAIVNSTSIDRYWEHYASFDKAPSKSASALAAGGSDDEMHIVVIDEDGLFTGTAGTVLETFGFVSGASDAKDASGQSNYYVNVLETGSQYVYVTGHETSTHPAANSVHTHALSGTTAFGRPSAPIQTSMVGGANGRTGTAGEKHGTWTDHFSDGETSDVSFLVVGSTRCDSGSGVDQDTLADWTTLTNQAILLCEGRKDCMAVVSPRRASVVNVTSESSQLTNVLADYATASSSSYAVFDSGWVYGYDRYNDKYCWTPACGHTAGLMVRSDLLRDAWFSPAGFSRGQYLGITKLAFNPSKSSRDDLYRNRINPVVTFAGQGTVLFGDKTALTVPSAFDRINVRRLFIVLEKAIATAAKAQLFEFNDAFTRAQFRAAVEPFLRDVKNRRGLVDFSVVCDETNNTDTVIDRNEFVCSIFVKPAKSINFITLNFVAARSGVEFSEIYGAV
jgi:hypothetical protein